MDQIAQKCQNWPEWPRMAQMAKNALIWPKMAQEGVSTKSVGKFRKKLVWGHSLKTKANQS